MTARRQGPRSRLEKILAAERYAVLVKYARLGRDGRPLTCRPSQVELADWRKRKEPMGSDGKIIFESRSKAEKCIEELSKLTNARPMIAYPCGRSRAGHHHIATDRENLYGAAQPRPRPRDPEAGRRRLERQQRRRAAKRQEDVNMFLVFSPTGPQSPPTEVGPREALIVATAFVDMYGSAIIHSRFSGRTYRLVAGNESEEDTAEVLADPEAMKQIAEAEEELAQRWRETGGREPTVEERAADRGLLGRARERSEVGEFIEYTEEDLRELREGGDAA